MMAAAKVGKKVAVMVVMWAGNAVGRLDACSADWMAASLGGTVAVTMVGE